MTTTVQVNASLQGSEDVSTSSPLSGTSGRTLRYTEMSVSQTIKSTTTPPVDSPAADLSHTLSGGSTTFDLTAVPLARDNSLNQDYTGKKLLGIHIKMDPANNAAGVLIEPNAANGYNVWGDSNGKVRVYPGQTVLYSFVDDTNLLPTVGASAKDIDFTGTSGDIWEAIAFFGT